MNIHRFINSLREMMKRYPQLKETQHLEQVMSFQQSLFKNEKWLYDVNSFIESIRDSYETLQYSIEKYQNGHKKVINFQTMNDYLMMAGLCITDEFFIEVNKKG